MSAKTDLSRLQRVADTINGSFFAQQLFSVHDFEAINVAVAELKALRAAAKAAEKAKAESPKVVKVDGECKPYCLRRNVDCTCGTL